MSEERSAPTDDAKATRGSERGPRGAQPTKEGGAQRPVGVRVFEGLEPGQRQPLARAVPAIIALTLYVGWVNIFILLLFSSLLSRTAMYISLALLSTLALPAAPVLWPRFNRLGLFKSIREYFRWSHLIEAPLEKDKKYIFVEFPHGGGVPLGHILGSTFLQEHYPELSVYSVAADSVFGIPLWRHIIAWIGAMTATRENFKKLLSMGSCAVSLGGIAEMYMLDAHRERIKVKGRKGFVKIAMEENVDSIIPVYHFGMSRCLDFGPQSWAGVSRRWRVSLALYIYGVWFTSLPRPVPLFMVFGKPIPVPKVDLADKAACSQAADKLLEDVIQGIQGVYDRHKHSYGWGDRPLSIE